VLPSSVAVLPFVNLSPNPDDGYFAAGIHEEVVSQLAKIRSLNVIARTSVLRYAGTTRPVPEIAAELRVATVLEGSVRYAGERVRVTAQLIDGATNTHLWTETYDGTVADVFAIQADIAMQIAAALEAELSPAEQASIGKQVTSSTDAYALYLKAIALYYESGGTIFMAPSARTTLQSYLDAAIAIDPDFATAFAWKAWIYSDSIVVEIPTPGGEIASNESRAEQIRINADRALALDETVGLAHAALARLHSAEWRAADALAAGERARQSSPNDPAVLYWSAAMSWLADHYDEAIRHANRGIELDQRNLSLYIVLSYALRASGREEEAAAALRRAIEINPRAEGPYVLLARSEIALSRTESALEALRSADQAAAPAASPNSHLRVDAAYSYARLGNRADVERLLSRFADGAAVERLSPGFRAVADLVRGDYRGAMERVEALVATGVLYADLVPAAFIRHNAWSDPVLEEPEWVALRAQLAFSQ
jgi:TolB-like protein/Flp pilus assembly protein TadD